MVTTAAAPLTPVVVARLTPVVARPMLAAARPTLAAAKPTLHLPSKVTSTCSVSKSKPAL